VVAVRWLARILTCVVVAAGTGCSTPPTTTDLPWKRVSETPLTGGALRFDYGAIDVGSGRLFIAHMGADQLVDVDLRARAVVRTVPGLSDVHGVIVVPEAHRLYATATGDNQMVALDEDSGSVVFRSPTGEYPDGLAYDPRRDTIWTTNEAAGTETVIDAGSGVVRATVPLGGEVGNVVYDSFLDRMVVAVQGLDQLVLVDPVGFAVTERIPTPGCTQPHGQALDVTDQIMFVGCEGNATMVAIDLANRSVIDRHEVGEGPDVLAFDPDLNRVYIAAESGWVSVLEQGHGHLTLLGSSHLADGAHSLVLDPRSHHVYIPIPRGPSGLPVLWEFEPV
jgi:DNA-binding beta-propeller fold protein YncE